MLPSLSRLPRQGTHRSSWHQILPRRGLRSSRTLPITFSWRHGSVSYSRIRNRSWALEVNLLYGFSRTPVDGDRFSPSRGEHFARFIGAGEWMRDSIAG